MDPATPPCRWCRAPDVAVVLDLGPQPPADWFPPAGSDPAGDPSWPLRMGLCGRCGLAQLLEDAEGVEEPRGIEPRALIEQAADAVTRIADAGLARPGAAVAEFDSPHGGSWRTLLTAHGCADVTGTGDRADLVVDVFGLMHDADQAEALRRRIDLVADDGVLLLQFHTLESIVRQQQWNALRHGHTAYYATSVLVDMLAAAGMTAYRAWTFELYGGTVLLAARRGAPVVEDSVRTLLTRDRELGVTTGSTLDALDAAARRDAADLTGWLAARRDEGRTVLGYGAASRAVPLLVRAGVDADLLPAIADGSPAKAGLRMPRSRIPIVPADAVAGGRADLTADVVLLFVPDLLAEIRGAYPQVAARGARWAVSEPRPRLVD